MNIKTLLEPYSRANLNQIDIFLISTNQQNL